MKNIFLVLVVVFILSSCGESEKEKIERLHQDSVKRADSIALALKPRKDIYDKAVEMIKSRLKVPTSLRIPAVQMQNDSVHIKMFGPDTAVVLSTYEAANAYGTLLAPDSFKVVLARREGKWGGRFTDKELSDLLDINLKYSSKYDADTYK